MSRNACVTSRKTAAWETTHYQGVGGSENPWHKISQTQSRCNFQSAISKIYTSFLTRDLLFVVIFSRCHTRSPKALFLKLFCVIYCVCLKINLRVVVSLYNFFLFPVFSFFHSSPQSLSWIFIPKCWKTNWVPPLYNFENNLEYSYKTMGLDG